jgi:oxygen-independent coproporphyrinogen III oxidase
MIDHSFTESVTAELLLKYDRPGPRYTSYPTAIEFDDSFGPEEYGERLAVAAQTPDEPLSLYIHLPFCHDRCTFCGCNVIITRKEEVSEHYLDYLKREIPLVAGKLGANRRVVQYHWGGGTPTYQTVPQMAALDRVVRDHFDIDDNGEVAIEVDPRVTTSEQLEALREMGFNRLSMGVQDFSPDVQEAINRNQTLEETEALFDRARALGFGSINLDLVYGLPLQTAECFDFTLEQVIRLKPDRVACYSFAHIPWIRGNQRRIEKDALPNAEQKFNLFGSAIRAFGRGGYHMIGMDHFALPGDEMARAAASRTLHRNFMGYTVMQAAGMIGFGVSSIGDLAGAYAQNTKKLSRYTKAIDEGVLPIEKGYLLTADDHIRRDVITRLMCNFHLDLKGVEERHGLVFADYFAEELKALEEPVGHGFVKLTSDAIEVVGAGRLFIRNVCMIFDVHTREKRGERPMFSRTV